MVSGISVEVKETDDGYTLSKVTKDGKQIQDKDTFTVTCLRYQNTWKLIRQMIILCLMEGIPLWKIPGQDIFQMVMPFLQSLKTT